MNKRDLTYGLLLFAGFAGYFFIMQAAELYYNYNLRIFNIIIHFGLVYFAIRSFFNSHQDKEFNYLSGTLAGFKPSLIGVLLFGIMQLVYLSIDDAFLQHLQTEITIGEYINPFTASFAVVLEGIGVSVIVSYIAMRIVDAQKIDPEKYEERL
jgi:hypothetical protein